MKAACRATFIPAPACSTQPMHDVADIGRRDAGARHRLPITTAPRSAAVSSLRDPAERADRRPARAQNHAVERGWSYGRWLIVGARDSRAAGTRQRFRAEHVVSRSPSAGRVAAPAARRSAASSAGPISSALVAAMSFQMSGGLDARRVVSARPRPASAKPSSPTASPTTCISALAVNCGRWLRNASSRSCAVTLDDAAARRRAPARTPCSFSTRRAGPVVRPASAATAVRETNRAARARARPWPRRRAGGPPMNVNRGGSARAASTIARLVLLVSVTTAGCRTCSSSASSSAMFCRAGAARITRSASASTIEIVGGDVDGVQPHRGLEHVLVVDGDDERGRPELARRQRNRSADQPEPDDADLLEDRRLSGAGRPGWMTGIHFDRRSALTIAIGR